MTIITPQGDAEQALRRVTRAAFTGAAPAASPRVVSRHNYACARCGPVGVDPFTGFGLIHVPTGARCEVMTAAEFALIAFGGEQ